MSATQTQVCLNIFSSSSFFARQTQNSVPQAEALNAEFVIKMNGTHKFCISLKEQLRYYRTPLLQTLGNTLSCVARYIQIYVKQLSGLHLLSRCGLCNVITSLKLLLQACNHIALHKSTLPKASRTICMWKRHICNLVHCFKCLIGFDINKKAQKHSHR